MKKLLLLLALPLLFACSSDKKEPTQDYTSFILYNQPDVMIYKVVTGWKDKDGIFHRIAEHEDLKGNSKSKEVRMPEHHSPIYVFMTLSPAGVGGTRLDAEYTLRENTLNIVNLTEDTKGITVDVTDPKQYPV